MPVEFEVDRSKERLRLTLTNPLNITEVVAALDRQVREGLWRYPVLVDGRRAILGPTDAGTLFTHVRMLNEQHGPSGSIALVTRDAIGLGGAQIYAFRSAEISVPVDLFWDIAEAERWLDARPATATSPVGGSSTSPNE